MSRKTELPSQARVDQALEELLDTSHTSGRQPSVLELARRLGVSNTTFRRNFPDAVQKIASAHSRDAPGSNTSRPAPVDRLAARNAKLRRANRDLAAALKLATAQIHKLAMHNQRLQIELEAATNVTRIGRGVTRR
ncbi:hypothetical protein ABZ904_32485 [Streptomyces sp. NPDC046900]|uniref:hypothetical protein n=1 Tax=Streptomyces sp. NPDC046900 TaxID=3155473 RepID=UPI0033C05E4A